MTILYNRATTGKGTYYTSHKWPNLFEETRAAVGGNYGDPVMWDADGWWASTGVLYYCLEGGTKALWIGTGRYPH